MTRARLRLATALIAVASLGALAWSGPALPEAQAAVRSGVCTGADSNAVTVVVDFQELGGGTAVYCVSDLAPGTTGMNALSQVIGVETVGGSFVCRLAGRPAAGETLTLNNGEAYQETCSTTPPATAYWSYWTAAQGGGWSYATSGAVSRSVVFGSYEGWSFSLNRGMGSAPAPRYSPGVWEVPPAPDPVPEPQPPPDPVPVPDPAPAQSSSAGGAPADSAAAPEGSAPATVGSSDPASPAVSGPATPASPSRTPSPSPTPGTPVTGSDDAADSSGPGWTAVVAVVLVVGLAGAGAGVAWWRKRQAIG